MLFISIIWRKYNYAAPDDDDDDSDDDDDDYNETITKV